MNRADLAKKILSYRNEHPVQRFVLLRDIEGVLDGSFRDLDLFAETFDENDFVSFLRENGFLVVKKVKRFRFTQFCVVDTESSIILLIDIWTKLHYKGLAYFKDFKLDQVLSQDGFFHLNAEDSLRVSYVKCLTQTGKVKEKYLNAIAAQHIDEGALSKDSILTGRTESFAMAAVNRIGWFCAHVADFLRPKQLVIYLIGPDGAGKTTISEALLASDIRAKKKYYHGRIPFLPRLQRIKGEKPKKVKFSDTNKRKFTVLHAAYYSLDSFLVRIILNLNVFRDRVIICDRTHYDIVARETYRNIPKAIKRILVSSLYRPNYCFLLYCTSREIHDRKPELPANEIEAQYVAYNEHKRWLSFSKIHTNADAKSISEIGAIIHDDLYRNG